MTRLKLVNITALLIILALYLSFSIAENRSYTSSYNPETGELASNLYSSALSPVDMIKGEVPAEYARKELMWSMDFYRYAAMGIVFLLVSAIVLQFLVRGHTLLSLVTIACIIVFFLLEAQVQTFGTLFAYSSSSSGTFPMSTQLAESRLNPVHEILSIMGVILIVFNLLHTVFMKYLGAGSSSVENFFRRRTSFLSKKKQVA